MEMATYKSLRSTVRDSSETYGTLYLVGLGLQMRDITVKGLNVIKKSKHVLVDEITRQILKDINIDGRYSQQDLEPANELVSLLELKDTGFDPNDFEICTSLLEGGDVAVVVYGDPLVFTNYSSLLASCSQKNISYNVIHNTSILNGVACCGPQLYRFGETVTMPFDFLNKQDSEQLQIISSENSFLSRLVCNRNNGWHTLCLMNSFVNSANEARLEIITPNDAGKILLKCLDLSSPEQKLNISRDTTVIVATGLASDSQEFIVCAISELEYHRFKDYLLYALIILGTLHPVEEECLSALASKIES